MQPNKQQLKEMTPLTEYGMCIIFNYKIWYIMYIIKEFNIKTNKIWIKLRQFMN